MHYTLHQLRIFLEISETKSITKAAESLHMTQPAVSIQLKKLQDQFEVPLYEVIGRQLHITDFGKEIVDSCEKILGETQRIQNRLMEFKGNLVGTLTISVVSTGKYVMPYFLDKFLSMHPGVDLVMDVTNKRQVVESLEKNEVDFSLVSVIPERLDLKRIRLMKNRLFLMGKDAEYSKSGAENFKLLSSSRLIYREPGSATRFAMESYLKKNGLKMNKSLELTSNEAVKQAVIAGLGLSIMPLIGIKNELHNGDLRIVPCKGLPVSTHWNLVWLKGKQFSPVAEAYIDYLNENKNNLIREKFAWYDDFDASKPGFSK